MTKSEIWQAFLDQYPQFEGDESIVKLKARGLKRLIDQAWDEGQAEGRNEAEWRMRNKQKPQNPFPWIK